MAKQRDLPTVDFTDITDPLFMTEVKNVTEKDDAPHGRDGAGEPLAPYGYNVDGRPRKSNRGARPGQKGNGASAARQDVEPITATTAQQRITLDDRQRAIILLQMTDLLLISPLAAMSTSRILKRYIGEKQADALAGDALVLDHFAVPFANSMIFLSQSKPGALAWLDAVQEKAPWIMLANVGTQIAGALIANHRNPDPAMADAGRKRAKAKMAAMTDAIKAEAEAAARAQAEQTERDAADGSPATAAQVNDFETAG